MPSHQLSDRPRLRLLLAHRERVAAYEQRFGYSSALMRSLLANGNLRLEGEIAGWIAALDAAESLEHSGGARR